MPWHDKAERFDLVSFKKLILGPILDLEFNIFRIGEIVDFRIRIFQFFFTRWGNKIMIHPSSFAMEVGQGTSLGKG